MNQDLDTLGKRVAFARKLRRLTQADLATRIGIGQSSIATLEGGRSKSSRYMHRLAEVLNVSGRWLDEGGVLPPELASEPQASDTYTEAVMFSAPTMDEHAPMPALPSPDIAAPQLKTLAQRLVYARERHQLTQGQLATKAGISQATVANLERGRNQATRKIVQLAEALRVTPQWLLYGTDDRLAIGRQVRKDFHVTSSAEAAQMDFHKQLANAKCAPPVETSAEGTLPVAPPPVARKLPVLNWMDKLLQNPLLAHTSLLAEAWYPCQFAHSPESFYLRVPGDSMAPEYRTHELILVDPQVKPENNLDVVAIDAQRNPAFARLTDGVEGRYLTILNPSYPDRVRRLTEDMQIVGVVTWSFVDRTKRN
ncbi:LexA family transcriptional regulator [Pseudomonas sp. D(2018)]|uniref:LexA family transcriptional regulator n=1 Tax=Pseudomonas sp. D(2018) TaxID=2502238 RepID=UPI0010F56FE7|nr:LexA family transcriptional regulator [Pseudomonas sp. D(2018)]